MNSRGPSRTAVRTAMYRAAHYLLDDEPKILADLFARLFAGFSTDEELPKTLADGSWSPVDFPRMRTNFGLRNRYAEDELFQAVQRGVSQYIMLGAGLDSFAYRRPDFMRTVEVYEVDHPASQRWKRERVAELGIETPAKLHYVPIDFEQETLAKGLQAGGVNRHARAFFSLAWRDPISYSRGCPADLAGSRPRERAGERACVRVHRARGDAEQGRGRSSLHACGSRRRGRRAVAEFLRACRPGDTP